MDRPKAERVASSALFHSLFISDEKTDENTTMHYYQLNIKSYQAATLHLTNEEDLAYRRLMDYYYDTETFISIKPDKATALQSLSRRLRVGMPELESVLNEFFILNEDGWKNEYCDKIIAEYKTYQERQRINGSKGGRGNKADAKPNKPTALPPLTQAKPNTKPTINNKQETINTPHGVSDSVFQDFLKLRKGLKAPVTPTAIKGLAREAEKANMTLEAVMELCCKNGWRGFDASWIKSNATKQDIAPTEGQTRIFNGQAQTYYSMVGWVADGRAAA